MLGLFRDLLPVLVFFGVYQATDIFAATLSAIAVSVIQVGHQFIWHRQVSSAQWISLVMIVILGAATLSLHDPYYIKMKPTAVYIAMALFFAFSPRFIAERTVLEKMLGDNVTLSDRAWRTLNTSWVVFFLSVATANYWVAQNCSTDTWVNFKLFGVLGLSVVFILGQAMFLSRFGHEREES